MNILVIAPQPFVVQRGTPIAVSMLLEALSSRGDTCDLLVYSEGEDVQIEGMRVFRVPALPGLKNFSPGLSLKKLVADAILIPMTARRMIGRKYDLVIAVEEAAFIAMAMKLIFRVPYLVDMDSSMPEQIDDKYGLPRWLRRILDAGEAMMLRRAAGAITCCRALEEIARAHAPEIPVRTIEDVTMIDKEASEDLPVDCIFDEPVVMYVGNLEPYQGVDLLMQGFALLDASKTDARLVVIGGTEDHIGEAKKNARRLGISDRVSFLGPRPLADLGRYLSASAICASPRTQGRNTPMKIYSYLDSGRPLIATRLQTHTQVLDDEIAMLVDPTPEDMARGLSVLLGDDQLRENMARAAEARVASEFSPASYRRKLDDFLTVELVPRLGIDSKAV